jgi:hypothetical protein
MGFIDNTSQENDSCTIYCQYLFLNGEQFYTEDITQEYLSSYTINQDTSQLGNFFGWPMGGTPVNKYLRVAMRWVSRNENLAREMKS